jgi:hypothetical protein
VLQRDPFAAARARAAELGLLAPGALPPLFVAVEAAGTRLSEPWNSAVAASCFTRDVVDDLGTLPALCSGTTIGSLRAVEAYLAAATAALPFCVSGGRGFALGVDQPLLAYLAHAAMLGASLRAAGVSGGDDDVEVSGSGGIAPLPPPPPPLSDALLAELEGLYASVGLARLPRFLASEEPAYRQLNRISTRLARTATVVPARHEDALLCSLAMAGGEHALRMERGDGEDAPLLVAPAAEGGGRGDGGVGGSGGGGGNGGAQACAVLHQYDRIGRLVKHFDVLLRGVNASSRYCETADGDERCY